MGIRACVVVCATSFLLGSLFTNWIADSLTLWKQPVLDENLWAAASYYSILSSFPPNMMFFLFAVVTLGATTILWSLRDGEAGNLMFDGGSIFLFATTVVVYSYSVIPTLRNDFSPLSIKADHDVAFPPALRISTLDLASSNLICSVALTGVLALQAGRYWADKEESETEESRDGPQLTSAPETHGERTDS